MLLLPPTQNTQARSCFLGPSGLSHSALGKAWAMGPHCPAPSPAVTRSLHSEYWFPFGRMVSQYKDWQASVSRKSPSQAAGSAVHTHPKAGSAGRGEEEGGEAETPALSVCPRSTCSTMWAASPTSVTNAATPASTGRMSSDTQPCTAGTGQ